VDLALASLRRAARRITTVVVVLYAGTGVLAAASVCMPGPHQHHGVPAPDCVMHHQDASHHGAAAGHHHSDAGHAHGGAPNDPGPSMTCACGEELTALHPADAAVPVIAEPWSPVLTAVDADPGADPRLPTFEPRSSSPPPRA